MPSVPQSAEERMLSFCARLPALDPDEQSATAEARHALSLLEEQGLRVRHVIAQGSLSTAEASSLRSEREAIEAAQQVVRTLVERRFGITLS